jgi:hypothetical protein
MEPVSPTPDSSPPSSPCGCDCRSVLLLLERCEGDPAFGRRDARTLALHLDRCAPCAERHGRRLAAAIGFVSLHERSVPAGLLDDLYASVHERAPYAPMAGGMSAAFLDGPRSLRLWRSTAAAAVLLLAVGGGWVLSNGVGGVSRAAPVPLRDVRDDHLQILRDENADAETRDPRFTTVSWPQHRATRVPGWAPLPKKAPVPAETPTPRRD